MAINTFGSSGGGSNETGIAQDAFNEGELIIRNHAGRLMKPFSHITGYNSGSWEITSTSPTMGNTTLTSPTNWPTAVDVSQTSRTSFCQLPNGEVIFAVQGTTGNAVFFHWDGVGDTIGDGLVGQSTITEADLIIPISNTRFVHWKTHDWDIYELSGSTITYGGTTTVTGASSAILTGTVDHAGLLTQGFRNLGSNRVMISRAGSDEHGVAIVVVGSSAVTLEREFSSSHSTGTTESSWFGETSGGNVYCIVADNSINPTVYGTLWNSSGTELYTSSDDYTSVAEDETLIALSPSNNWQYVINYHWDKQWTSVPENDTDVLFAHTQAQHGHGGGISRIEFSGSSTSTILFQNTSSSNDISGGDSAYIHDMDSDGIKAVGVIYNRYGTSNGMECNQVIIDKSTQTSLSRIEDAQTTWYVTGAINNSLRSHYYYDQDKKIAHFLCGSTPNDGGAHSQGTYAYMKTWVPEGYMEMWGIPLGSAEYPWLCATSFDNFCGLIEGDGSDGARVPTIRYISEEKYPIGLAQNTVSAGGKVEFNRYFNADRTIALPNSGTNWTTTINQNSRENFSTTEVNGNSVMGWGRWQIQ